MNVGPPSSAGLYDAPRRQWLQAELAASRVTGPGGNGGSLDEAIRLYERLAGLPEVEDEVLLVLAQLKLRAGQNAGAISAATRLTAQRPGDPLPIRVLVQTLTADVDYGFTGARTKAGTIGVKVWIYRGEKLTRKG